MKERLSNNLGLKILSIVLAVFTWLIMVNVSNPLMTDSREIQVDMLNEEVLEKSNLTYEVIGKSTVTVSYKVRTRDRYKISESDFYAYADLAQLYDVTGSIPVQVEISDRSVRSLIEGTVTAKPNVVRIQTEALQRKRFEVNAAVSGDAENGYALGDVSLSLNYVYVTGAVSVIGQISSVGVEIAVENPSSDVEGTATLKFYDANGNELALGDKIKVNVSSIRYQIPVLRVKNVSLDFQVGGTVADGYRYTGAECGVNTVSIEGMKSALASINTLTIPQSVLNVDGATGDVMIEVNLSDYLPENVTLAGGKEIKAVVTLKVEELVTETFPIAADDVIIMGKREGYSYTFEKDWLEIMVSGLREDLEVLDLGTIEVSIDVSDLQEGRHLAMFNVVLPDGFDMRGHENITIDVEKEDEGASIHGVAATGGSSGTED